MDREKVINGLEHCKIGDCVGCPYDQIRKESLHGKHDKWELVCNEQLTEDILAMLKEQETTIKAQQFVLNNACEKLKEQKIAMKPKNIDKVGGNCPVCGLRMARSHKYCYQCGQEMDWE